MPLDKELGTVSVAADNGVSFTGHGTAAGDPAMFVMVDCGALHHMPMGTNAVVSCHDGSTYTGFLDMLEEVREEDHDKFRVLGFTISDKTVVIEHGTYVFRTPAGVW